MKASAQNAIKDCQVLIIEAQLYSGAIDGGWGPGTAGGLNKLFQVNTISAGTGDAGALQGCKDLQTALQAVQLYSGGIDGVLGQGSMAGLQTVFQNYRSANNTPVYDLAWSKSVPAAFIQKIKDWVQARGLNQAASSWLMACMAFESGGTFSPSKQNNGGSNYFGLIQFGDQAASDLGTTLDAIKAMSQLDQLDLVFAYFDMWAKRGKTYTQLEDFYLTIFYPAAVGMSPDSVLFTANSPNPLIAKSYIQNKGFDFNNDGSITIAEISATVRNKYYAGMLPVNRVTVSS
jgi:hypothetical protein